MFLPILANVANETENVWGLSLNVLVTGIVVVFAVLFNIFIGKYVLFIVYLPHLVIFVHPLIIFYVVQIMPSQIHLTSIA